MIPHARHHVQGRYLDDRFDSAWSWRRFSYFRSTPDEQTFAVSDGMSQKGQERVFRGANVMLGWILIAGNVPS